MRTEKWLQLLHGDCASEDPEVKARAIGRSLDVQARYLALHGIDVSPKGDTINVAIIANSTEVRTAIDSPELLAQLEAAVGQLGLPEAYVPSALELGGFAGDDAIELEAVEQGEEDSEEGRD